MEKKLNMENKITLQMVKIDKNAPDETERQRSVQKLSLKIGMEI